MVRLNMENNDDGRTVVKMSSQDSKTDLIFFLPEDFSQEPKDRLNIYINKTKNQTASVSYPKTSKTKAQH